MKHSSEFTVHSTGRYLLQHLVIATNWLFSGQQNWKIVLLKGSGLQHQVMSEEYISEKLIELILNQPLIHQVTLRCEAMFDSGKRSEFVEIQMFSETKKYMETEYQNDKFTLSSSHRIIPLLLESVYDVFYHVDAARSFVQNEYSQLSPKPDQLTRHLWIDGQCSLLHIHLMLFANFLTKGSILWEDCSQNISFVDVKDELNLLTTAEFLYDKNYVTGYLDGLEFRGYFAHDYSPLSQITKKNKDLHELKISQLDDGEFLISSDNSMVQQTLHAFGHGIAHLPFYGWLFNESSKSGL